MTEKTNVLNMAGFLLVLLLFITPVAWLLYRFMTADGDLTLLRHGPALRKAVENKVVWITGASQGIGEALAQQFAQLGAKLILSARRVEELERVKASLSGKSTLYSPNVPSGVVILPFDIAAGVEAIQQAVTKAEAFFDGAGVDYIVHNAAHTRPDTFALNVFGTIHLTRLLVPSMIKRGGGNVVVVSSIAGKLPSPAQTIYAASKHAVNGYFHSLRAELANKNIKVTIACPGPIKTTPSAGNLNSVSAKLQLSERRLSVSRCAELITIAATHGLKEVWISQHPMLLLLYVTQYLPSVGYAIIDKIGPKRVSSQGQDAYSVKLFFGGRKKDI
ncbi:hypothetical protein GOP47_0008163 [Adiantum capillus-veneris]|uniref:Ketoreductase domain-containing protein n=1 Tax=Adiantum capillus-veneris TaxID=13818 RepID=A0A9D4UYT3_ADICA|nr:hypothetical protein GOP47_0008163 [Adiantum capillus-veneris]